MSLACDKSREPKYEKSKMEVCVLMRKKLNKIKSLSYLSGWFHVLYMYVETRCTYFNVSLSALASNGTTEKLQYSLLFNSC